jgi:hypothetical protein
MAQFLSVENHHFRLQSILSDWNWKNAAIYLQNSLNLPINDYWSLYKGEER